MSVTLERPGITGLAETVQVLGEWQTDDAPMQLHPGDIGWYQRFGPEATAAAVRSWRRAGQVLAVGLIDGPGLLRLTTAPQATHDEELAEQVVADVTDPHRGILGEGRATVEAPADTPLQALLAAAGWAIDEAWTPLRRDLTDPVEDPGVRVETVGPELVPTRVALQRAAFAGSTFTEDRWWTMADGDLYADARCLVAFDGHGAAVATVTVWSAGVGRPGLIEPLGAHPDHRGRGYGTAITVAAAAALRELGSSSAVVCTPSANVAGVAAYRSAGFQALPEVRDRRRGG